MKITDEAVEALSVALIGAAWVTFNEGLRDTLRGIHREALEAALPHLTDDGAAATPPAAPTAAESATPVPAGAAASSSPRAMATATSLFEHQRHRSPHPGCAWCPDVPGEGATPAIDREALVRVMNAHPIGAFNGSQVVCGCNLTWQTSAEYRTHLADAVLALIGGAA